MYFNYYLPFEKGVALHLNKRESPSPKYALCQVGLVDENVKSLRQRQQPRRRQRLTTDKFWSEKLTWAFGSGDLKTF